jgi:dihydroorotate dehydrogenase (NAD+) catalytic subunit
VDLTVQLGPMRLRSPLVAASGTVGSVADFAGVASLRPYGAAVAKSVTRHPRDGLPAPRLAPVASGMLNAIGIQNPGIDVWLRTVAPRIADLEVPVWGSAAGDTADEIAEVAAGLESGGVAAVELNLSCPNLEGRMFSLDGDEAAAVVSAVRPKVALPIGAKLSPNAQDIAAVAGAVAEAGADFVVLTNSVWGAAIDTSTRRPALSGVVGGYSGVPLRPIALRCVIEVRRALPELPIVGCGGVRRGEDVAEFLLAGANAVACGTVHFAEPRAGRRILRQLVSYGRKHGVERVADLVGAMEPW